MYGGAESGERLVDLAAPLHEDVGAGAAEGDDEAALKVVRHSAAHVMATAILGAVSRDQAGAWSGDGFGVLL